MGEHTLQNCRILIVEDEYLLARELVSLLGDEGATVLGPVATVAATLALINSEKWIDGALLDLRLRDEMSFPAADILANRDVPFVFTTGCDRSVIPIRFQGIVRCEKPVQMHMVVRSLGGAIKTRSTFP